MCVELPPKGTNNGSRSSFAVHTLATGELMGRFIRSLARGSLVLGECILARRSSGCSSHRAAFAFV